MSIALWNKVEQLEKRVESLEHARDRSRDPLHVRNAVRKAEGARLRKAIERILAAHPEFTAKHVLRSLSLSELGRTAMPSVRAVQWHINAVRNTACCARVSEERASH